MGVPHASLKLPPGCAVKVCMYFLGYKERSRVLPKHIRKKCTWSLQGCELFLKNAIKVCGSVVGVN